MVYACINYNVSVTHYKHPYDAQMAWNSSALDSVLVPGASNRDNTVSVTQRKTVVNPLLMY